MAVFSTERVNLVEAFAREKYTNKESLLGPLVQNNDFLRVASVLPSNKGAIHETLIADDDGVGGSVRNANEPITMLTSKTHIRSEQIVSYQGDSDVDELTLQMAPDRMAVRASEDAINLNKFSNGWTDVLVYGNAATSKGFEGLAARRNKKSMKSVSDMKGSSTGGWSSIYIVEFGENGLSLRYAPGAGTPGISVQDMGRNKISVTGGYFWGWTTHYEISFGLSIRDDRALQRIANIPVNSVTPKDLIKELIKAKNRLPNRGKNAFIFANGDVKSILDIAALDGATNLTTVEIENYGPVTSFVGLPVLTIDRIKSDEAEVK